MSVRWRDCLRPINLKPCPLCGAPARISMIETGIAALNATIECCRCGLTLKWETKFATHHTAHGDLVVEKIGLDPFEAWNRRAKHD